MALDNQNIHGADDMLRRLNEAREYIARDAPQIIGIEAVKHFKNNFVEEGFVDGGVNKWASRKTKVALQKKVLTGQGSGDHLSDSIDYRVEGQTVIISSDREYAQIHNEGGEITVTEQMRKFFWAKYYEAKEAADEDLQDAYRNMALSKTITIPQRKFMGESATLIERIVQELTRDLTRILNS